jgi:hypothetical protein
MDDLFDAFADSTAQGKLETTLTVAAGKASGVKRPRDAPSAPPAAASGGGGEAGGAPAPHAPAAAQYHGSGRKNLGAAVLAGLEGANFSVDAAPSSRGEATHVVVRPGAGSGAGGMAVEADSDEEGAGSAAGKGLSGGGGGGGGGSAVISGLGGKAAPKLLSSEIGEALRPVLARGEIDDSKTTAPPLSGGGGGGGGGGDGLGADGEAAARPAPARVYPFTLDPFQQRASECLERNESVLVSAHTSAGKTVVAERKTKRTLCGSRMMDSSHTTPLSLSRM